MSNMTELTQIDQLSNTHFGALLIYPWRHYLCPYLHFFSPFISEQWLLLEVCFVLFLSKPVFHFMLIDPAIWGNAYRNRRLWHALAARAIIIVALPDASINTFQKGGMQTGKKWKDKLVGLLCCTGWGGGVIIFLRMLLNRIWSPLSYPDGRGRLLVDSGQLFGNDFSHMWWMLQSPDLYLFI